MKRTHWITTAELAALPVNNVFHRQLDRAAAESIHKAAEKIQNKHILFRKKFQLDAVPEKMTLRISVDDYYKLYINGEFAGQGPAPAYHFHYFYNELDITRFLHPGENTFAIHTYYQGLINRVWVSGDNRHGLWLEMSDGNEVIIRSDETFLCAEHTAFSSCGTVGYETQFLEKYDASAAECDFHLPDFDDSSWLPATVNLSDDHTLVPPESQPLVFEKITPAEVKISENRWFIDFGAMYVGYLTFRAGGKAGDEIIIRCGQELNDDGSVRFDLRANCRYEESFILSGKRTDQLNQFDFKSFRYVELIVPQDVDIEQDSFILTARHYPFELKRQYTGNDEKEKLVWDLCVRTIRYGVQCVIHDCMEREKGYYLGDGCYSLLTYCLLTEDFSMMEKFFDDFLRTAFITPGLVTCANCSFMQEIAEYPLIMFTSLLEYTVLTGNYDFVRKRFKAFASVLDSYRESYAQEDGLINNLDKWCVVDWPKERRDGYDVDVTQGVICTTRHSSINAYYIGAVKCLNKVAKLIGMPQYADSKVLEAAYVAAFHDPVRKVYRDSESSGHVSLPGNAIAWWFDIIPDEETRANIIGLVRERRLNSVLFFTTFPIFCALKRDGEDELLHSLLTDENTWLNIIREGGTTTFEGWSKDHKWNTSLFHLTLSFGAAFLTDWRIKEIFTFD